MAEAARSIAIGDNNPPDIAEALKIDLPYLFDADLKRRDELVAACGRVPDVIENDETAGKLGDFIVQITGHKKASEAKRVAKKEPYLAAGRVVDGFFKGIIDPLDDWHKKLQRRHTSYLVAKEDRERRDREEQARVERERATAALLAAQEAERRNVTDADALIDQAVTHEAEAAALQAEAEGSAADLSRVRGGGSVTSLRTIWTGQVVDLEAVPLERLRPFLSIDVVEQALRSFVRAGGRDLAGCRIFEQKTAQTR